MVGAGSLHRIDFIVVVRSPAAEERTNGLKWFSARLCPGTDEADGDGALLARRELGASANGGLASFERL